MARATLGPLLALLLGGCASPPSAPVASAAPTATPIHGLATTPASQAVVTAHPLATRAGLDTLARGGSAVDAAIAAQMVLGLVESQSSGVGGGSLILYWSRADSRLSGHDGLAAAPGKVTAGLTVDADGSAIRLSEVERGPRSVGIPGTLAVLSDLHRRHGKLPWASLFTPAIELAEGGYPMPAYARGVLSAPTAARDHPDMVPLYFDADGKPLPVGTVIRNPAYARTLRGIAEGGPSVPWQGESGAAVMQALGAGPHPSFIRAEDFARYQPRDREPVCAPFLAYRVCSMAPPSFGGVVVLQMLQMLQARPVPAGGSAAYDFDDPAFAHYFAEAGRLAQADRQRFIGDPDFVSIPLQPLVSGRYLQERAARIDADKAAASHPAGQPGSTLARMDAHDEAPAPVADATSQLAVVDGMGNALSMTTTINLNFGSRIMVNGFVLNDALTNFTTPVRGVASGPNRMEAGKRPITSMAPTIVFDRNGQPVVVGGSAGGGQIVDYVAQSLVEMLANDRTPAQALARGHVSTAVSGRLELESGTPAAGLQPALAARGHAVSVVRMTSGLGFLKRSGEGWLGAADPRRDGVAEGR